MILLVMAVGAYFGRRRYPDWLPTLETRLHLRSATALQQARTAAFATIEQVKSAGPAADGRVYRVQARLLGFRLGPNRELALTLGSLVHSGETLQAYVLPASAAGNDEDAALYAELRQDIALQFGAPALQPTRLPSPPQVIVTGRASTVSGALALRPVFDFRVQ